MQETDEIKARLPIEQIVGKYVPLKKAGRVYKGLCPFHNEKTPSFTVNPDRGIYKCFGCGEGGDIFDLTMKLEGLSFPEALKLLAEQAGVELTEQQAPVNPDAPSKTRLFALNAYVAKFWHTVLISHPKAEPGREYLASRGLSRETIDLFQIGLAPSAEATLQGLQKQEYTDAEIRAAGDPTRFRNRIVFPIADITGRTVGFTGRIFAEAPPNVPKYWNTPETPLFIKGRIVFALHLAKQAIQAQDLALLAEGQMDVVTLHQHGYQNAVASSGTALTPEQLRLISRFSRNIAFAYDSDKAGIAATERGIDLALAEELNPYVIVIPNGKDPADCLQNDPELWNQAYAERVPFMGWLLQKIIGDGELTPQRKKELAGELQPWLLKVRSQVERRDWIRLVAAQLQVSENVFEAGRAPVSTAVSPTPQTSSEKSAEQDRAETALALLLANPEAYPYIKEQLTVLKNIPQTPFLEAVLGALDPSQQTLTQSLEKVDAQAQKMFFLQAEEVLKPYQTVELAHSEVLTEILSILGRMRSESKEASKSSMAERIRAAQASGKTEEVKSLLLELKALV